jgi:hypothetical protein
MSVNGMRLFTCEQYTLFEKGLYDVKKNILEKNGGYISKKWGCPRLWHYCTLLNKRVMRHLLSRFVPCHAGFYHV